MKPLQARLSLLAATGLGFFIGFGILAYQNYRDYSEIMAGVSESSLVLENAQGALRSGDKTAAKTYLENAAVTLQPSFRAENVKKILKSDSKANLILLVDSESRFQKYSFEMARIRQQRVFTYSVISFAFSVLMTLGFIIVNSRWVFFRLSHLNERMLDFLQSKYSYEFETPEKTELGEIEQTFNLMAQKVLDQIEALKKLDTAKSEFLSIASHELRTPLTSIKGSLSLMRAGVAGKMNDATQNLMSIALTETDRLIRLINDLLDLAKIEAGGVAMTLEWTGVEALLKKTAASLEGFATSAKVKIEVLCENPIEGYIDLDRTQQVITNLASNAIKFSPQGGVVTLKALVNEEQKLLIEVIDQGPGIAPQDQELIFEKFRQATSPENPLVKGTGLGLAIAKGLVEEQGGSLHVRSAPTQGSTFYFALPKWRLQKPGTGKVA